MPGAVEPAPSPQSADGPVLGPRAAGALVFVASGSVLVLEIASLRLVAPYLGLTLETNTAVIGFALAAIAAGAWFGGLMADIVTPQRVLGPTMMVGGGLMSLVAPLVRVVGQALEGAGSTALLLLVGAVLFLPAALLSAIPPMVVKVRLASLAETGTVVGRLSGIGTLGAIAATFGTGFFLIAVVPTSVILEGLGVVLVLVGGGLTTRFRSRRAMAASVVVIAAATGFNAVVADPCEVETTYHCASVVTDPSRPTGRILQLDTLRHSYVDLDDPTYLQFGYVKTMASVVDVFRPAGTSVRALHIGGGALTVPRYLAATRPGSQSLVYEIDHGVVDLVIERTGLQLGHGIEVDVDDGRLGLQSQDGAGWDLVVGDAFGGLAVPWHLATREAVRAIHRALTPDGVYVVNVIDSPRGAFVRAEMATIATSFSHVAVVAARSAFLKGGTARANFVVVASDRALPIPQLRDRLATRDSTLELVSDVDQVRGFVGGAKVLTDDFAPVDQILALGG
jgi:spermidine synthase